MPAVRTKKEITLNKFFTGINESAISKIFKQENFKEVSEGEIIYQTGDEAKYFYLLLRGDVKIKFPSQHYISNKIFNDFFGEKEITDNIRRISSAVADTRCLLYLIEKEILKSLIEKSQTLKRNLETYGDLELPENQSNTASELEFAQSSKPISFKAISNKENDKQDNSENNPPGEKDLMTDTISGIIEEQNPFGITNTEDIFEPPVEEEEKPALNIELDDDGTIENTDINSALNEAITETAEEFSRKVKPEIIPDSSYANMKHLLAALSSIHNKNRLTDTIQSVKDVLTQLTSSDEAELFLIDEPTGSMRKYVYSENRFEYNESKISEGLTGTCALQKKIINFENPAEDSRFIPEIDLPGSGKFSSILYFPIENDKNELVAVLQLARNIESYSKEEIANLKLISNQIALSLQRSLEAEEIILSEKKSSIKEIAQFLSENLTIPIKIINNYSNLLNKEEFSQKVKEIITMLQKQSNSFLDIIQSTFDYATEDYELTFETININSFLNEVSELLSEYCITRNVDLFKKTGEDVLVNIDPGKFFMAVYQLIKNVCDNSDDNGKLFISTDKNEDSALLTIKDEQRNLSPEEINEIFEPQSSEKKKSGRIGLLLAKNLIKENKGNLTVSSEEGQGVIFTISLPIASETE